MHVDSPGVSVASATLRATDAPPENTSRCSGRVDSPRFPRRVAIARRATIISFASSVGFVRHGVSRSRRDTGRIVTFKVMRKTKLVDVGEANHASEERRLHERISDGPFINRLLASFQDPWALFLILEYAPCGDLFQAMNFHGLPTRGDAVTYAVQVATALEHLHGLGYVYRDLKPENILLHPHGSVQLADFGMGAPGSKPAHVHHLRHRAVHVSGGAAAPRMPVRGGPVGDGHLRVRARDGRHAVQLHQRVATGAVAADEPRSGADSDAPAVDRQTASLVRALLRNAEHERLGAGGKWHELYAHVWFAGVDVLAVQRGDITPQLSPEKAKRRHGSGAAEALERGDVPWRRGAVIEDPATLALFERF